MKLILYTKENAGFSHYTIRLDGTIEKGLNDSLGDSIRIYLGEHDTTPEQREAIFNLVGKLMIKYNIPADEIHCQSFNFIEEFFKWMRDEME